MYSLASRTSRFFLATLLVSCVMLCGQALGFTITTYPGSIHQEDTAAMDAALGLEGFLIEGFEDTSLVDGLSIQLEDPDSGPFTELQNLFDPAIQWTNNEWDGTHAFTITSANLNWNPGRRGELARVTTFHVAPGTTAFAVGIANFQMDVSAHELAVNGESLGLIEDLPNYQDGINLRNLYFRIDAEDAETIQSVSITQDAQGLDGLVFDHLAFRPALPSADFDKDGDVDGEDFLIWQTAFPTLDGSANSNTGDANGDGNADGEDFLIWQNEFGIGLAGAGQSAVPEPAACILAMLTVVAVPTWHRR